MTYKLLNPFSGAVCVLLHLALHSGSYLLADAPPTQPEIAYFRWMVVEFDAHRGMPPEEHSQRTRWEWLELNGMGTRAIPAILDLLEKRGCYDPEEWRREMLASNNGQPLGPRDLPTRSGYIETVAEMLATQTWDQQELKPKLRPYLKAWAEESRDIYLAVALMPYYFRFGDADDLAFIDSLKVPETIEGKPGQVRHYQGLIGMFKSRIYKFRSRLKGEIHPEFDVATDPVRVYDAAIYAKAHGLPKPGTGFDEFLKLGKIGNAQEGLNSNTPQPVKHSNAGKPLNTIPSTTEQPQHGWLVWLFVALSAALGAVWVFLRKTK